MHRVNHRKVTLKPEEQLSLCYYLLEVKHAIICCIYSAYRELKSRCLLCGYRIRRVCFSFLFSLGTFDFGVENMRLRR
jgi:hypothetical protein